MILIDVYSALLKCGKRIIKKGYWCFKVYQKVWIIGVMASSGVSLDGVLKLYFIG